MRRIWAASRAQDSARWRRNDDGMSTAEYAVGTVAACGFGGVLYQILTSGFASNLLEGLISHALSIIP